MKSPRPVLVIALLALLALPGCVAVYSGLAVGGGTIGYAHAAPEHEVRDSIAGAAIAAGSVGAVHFLIWGTLQLIDAGAKGLAKAYDDSGKDPNRQDSVTPPRRFARRRMVRP